MLESRRAQVFAAILSATAGFVDAVGWLTSGGLFVSFMSGNVTKLGIGLTNALDNAWLAIGLISAFVTGVVTGSLLGRAMGTPRQPRAVLWLVTGLLAIAALVQQAGPLIPAVLLLAAAMGAKNTVFAEDGEVRVGLTYMTGALVRIGKRIATALRGGDRFGWVFPFLLFLGMLGGAASGAVAFAMLGPQALWLATAILLLLTLLLGWAIPRKQVS